MKTGMKIAIAGGSLLTIAALWGFKKKSDFEEVITQMTMDVSNIRNLRTKNLKMMCDCDVTFKNNTSTDFSINTGGFIAIKRISLYYKDKLLGNALSNTTKFTLPANGSEKIENVAVEFISLNIINQILSGSLDGNPANYKIEVEIVALGKTYLIEQ